MHILIVHAKYCDKVINKSSLCVVLFEAVFLFWVSLITVSGKTTSVQLVHGYKSFRYAAPPGASLKCPLRGRNSQSLKSIPSTWCVYIGVYLPLSFLSLALITARDETERKSFRLTHNTGSYTLFPSGWSGGGGGNGNWSRLLWKDEVRIDRSYGLKKMSLLIQKCLVIFNLCQG